MGQTEPEFSLPATTAASGKYLLRQQLHLLTAQQPSHVHALAVLALAGQHAGAFVRVLNTPFELPPPLYNCVMYALDLVDRFEPQLQHQQGLDFRYLADTGFLALALACGTIHRELPCAQAEPGDLVVYFDGQQPAHAAKYLGAGRCASKWGPSGLYAHGLWDLPLHLGSSARFYCPPDPQAVLALLCERVPGLRLTASRATPAPTHWQPSTPPSGSPRAAAPAAH